MKTKLIAVLAVGAVLAFGASRLIADKQSDAETSLKVQVALLEKLGHDGMHVNVDTEGGAVHLSGTVNKRETAELASTVAQSVSGVSSVKDDIDVVSPPGEGKAARAVDETEAELKDALLKSKVKLALVDKLGKDGFRIGADVANGVVTLSFPPDLSASRRDDAKAAAKAVSGVRNLITVDKH